MVKDSMNEGLPSHGQSNGNAALYIGFAIALVVVAAGAFVGGMQYQKSTGGSSTTATTQTGAGGFGGAGGGFGGTRRSGGFGTVTAVSGTSITISETTPGSDSSSGTSKTYAITSSTTVTDSGQSASVSDIQTGDRVIIRTSTSDTSTASSIMVNPTFGGGAGGGTGGQTQSDSSTDNSDSSTTNSSI
jgi:hypothetical protein